MGCVSISRLSTNLILSLQLWCSGRIAGSQPAVPGSNPGGHLICFNLLKYDYVDGGFFESTRVYTSGLGSC